MLYEVDGDLRSLMIFIYVTDELCQAPGWPSELIMEGMLRYKTVRHFYKLCLFVSKFGIYKIPFNGIQNYI
jgi:hypothetical protein